jgi:hypothetical protein
MLEIGVVWTADSGWYEAREGGKVRDLTKYKQVTV